MPFRTPLRALEHVKGGAVDIFVRKTAEEGYVTIAKAALKKAQKTFNENKKKAEKAAERAAQEAKDKEKNAAAEAAKLEAAKSIVLEEDKSLGPAKKVGLVEVCSGMILVGYGYPF